MNVKRIALIELDDAGGAQLLRLHLEQLGCDLALNRLGKPSDFFAGFSFHDQSADATIISAHGDEGGFIFPEMAEGVDRLVLPDNRITPDLIASRLKSLPPLVISTACSTGSAEFARAFKQAGALAYIAPNGDPDGRDVALWVAAFFHALSRNDRSINAAVASANALVEADSQFQIFT